MRIVVGVIQTLDVVVALIAVLVVVRVVRLVLLLREVLAGVVLPAIFQLVAAVLVHLVAPTPLLRQKRRLGLRLKEGIPIVRRASFRSRIVVGMIQTLDVVVALIAVLVIVRVVRLVLLLRK